MNTNDILLTTLTNRRAELQEQRQAFVLQAERQVAFFDGQVAEIDRLLKALTPPAEGEAA